MNIIVNPYINKKLGYYICDNMEFGSKIQACFHGVKTQRPVQWIFNNDVFKQYDWTIEPEHDLDYYYNLRARQIREQYDYVVLSYSGGSDSHNIYESFRRQGLHIDEILVNTMETASQKILDPSSRDAVNAPLSEHRLHTLPRLKEIAVTMPKTKITIVDLSSYVFKNFESIGDASWVMEKREGLNPIGITRFNYLHQSEIRKRFDKNYQIGLIIGCEKPRTLIYNGNLAIRFSDRSANINTVADHYRLYTNCTVEFFYWSPDCVPLLIKQGHVIKRYLEANPDMQIHWKLSTTNESFRLIHEPLLRTLIYTTWNNHWFQGKKSINDWYSEFDYWFLKNYNETKAYHVWREGIEYIESNLEPFLRISDITKKPDGLLPVHHHYSLGKMKVLAPSVGSWLH